MRARVWDFGRGLRGCGSSLWSAHCEDVAMVLSEGVVRSALQRFFKVFLWPSFYSSRLCIQCAIASIST